MHEELEQLDCELAHLAQSVRGGDHIHACLELAEFAIKLDCYIQREERALSLVSSWFPVSAPRAIAVIQREHTSLRQLVAAIARALDRADDHVGLDTVGTLRSVLLLHAAKEERLLARNDQRENGHTSGTPTARIASDTSVSGAPTRKKSSTR